MHDETFEQLHVVDSLIEFGDDFLKEGESYAIQVVDAMILGIEWPKTMVFVVTEAPPEIKRATATSSLRPVVLENGITVNAPGFIKNGDTIRINTTDKSYVERV
jgi:elongation factor P